MTRNYLLWGLLLLLLASLSFSGDDRLSPNVASSVSHEVKQTGDGDALKNDYPFLNEGLEYRITPREEFIFPEDLPEGIHVVTVYVGSGTQLEAKLGHFQWSYLVDGRPTVEQLQLMEYDVLITAYLLQFHIFVQFLNNYSLSEEELLDFGRRLSWGWMLSREMAYPEAVAEIYQNFIEATEWAAPFMGEPGEVYPNTTMTIRALGIYAPGGGPAGGYTSRRSTQLFYRGKLALLELLEAYGIRPY